MATKAQIRSVMKTNVEDCRDPKTGEINHTQLAEMTACDLDLYVDHLDYEIPEYVFELALNYN